MVKVTDDTSKQILHGYKSWNSSSNSNDFKILGKYQDLGHLTRFVDENFEWKFYTFIRPNQEHLRKMQLSALWQESNLRSCDSDAAL